jgi:hypothetical protein
MRAFAAVLDAIQASRCTRTDADAALIVPAYLDTAYPFTDPADRAHIARTLAQAYVATRLADLPVALTRGSTGSAAEPGSTSRPRSSNCSPRPPPAWNGSPPTAPASTCPPRQGIRRGTQVRRTGGSTGPSASGTGSTRGISHPIEDEIVEFSLRGDFGGLSRGDTLRFTAAGNQHSRSFLPAEPAGAEILATDGRGRPALLLRRTGRGSLILCAYPIEHMAALTPRVNPDDTVVLYGALAAHAGVSRPVAVDDPRVACDTLIRDDGALFAVLVSHAHEPLTVRPVLSPGSGLVALSGKAGGSVTLAPFETKIFTVTSSSNAELAIDGTEPIAALSRRADGRSQHPDLLDLDFHVIARCQEHWRIPGNTDARRGASRDNVTGQETDHARNIRRDFGGAKDHLSGGAVLHHLPVDSGLQVQASVVSKFVGRHEHRTDWSGAIGILAQRHVPGRLLICASTQVEKAGVAEEGAGSVASV